VTVYDIVISGGTLVTPQGQFRGDLGIAQGRIEALSESRLEGRERIDARGLHVLPGAVDLHVHFNEPGRGHWEGWAFGSRAALLGGVTTVVEMPLNAVPATVNRAALGRKLEAARAGSAVDYALWGGLVDDNLADLSSLHHAGTVGFKAFMVDIHDDSFRFTPEPILREGMRLAASLGARVAVHAEDSVRAWSRTHALMAAGRTDLGAWLEARDPLTELSAVRVALELARDTGCALHVVHNSLPEGVELLARAKRAGQAVTLEVCPHHLLLTDQDFLRLGTEAKCAPPLRDRARLEGLWAQLAAGEVDCLASDHSPCPPEDKLGDVWRAWGGISGIQTLLPLMLCEGRKRGLALEHLIRLLCTRPAQIAGIADRKGALALGLDADVVLIDLERDWTVQTEWLASRHPHSPFVGWTVRGWLERTVLRGQTLMSGGAVRPEVQGLGYWLPRAGVGEGAVLG